MICVFDSSVWISGLNFGGTPLAALKLAARNHSIAICALIHEEIYDTLAGKFRWSPSRIQAAFMEFEQSSFGVATVGNLRGICRDPNDDMILECAILAKADLIISGDKDLLSLGSYEGVRILPPREFIDLAEVNT